MVRGEVAPRATRSVREMSSSNREEGGDAQQPLKRKECSGAVTDWKRRKREWENTAIPPKVKSKVGKLSEWRDILWTEYVAHAPYLGVIRRKVDLLGTNFGLRQTNS